MSVEGFRSTLCLSLKCLTKCFPKVRLLRMVLSFFRFFESRGRQRIFFFLIDTLQCNESSNSKTLKQPLTFKHLSGSSDGGGNNCISSKSCRARHEIREKKKKNALNKSICLLFAKEPPKCILDSELCMKKKSNK